MFGAQLVRSQRIAPMSEPVIVAQWELNRRESVRAKSRDGLKRQPWNNSFEFIYHASIGALVLLIRLEQ
jgi:hypothetical protein